MPSENNQADAIWQLRQQIAHLECFQQGNVSNAVSTGIASLDQAMPNGSLPRGVIHEFISHRQEDEAASVGFAVSLLSLLARQGGSTVWITKGRHIFPLGLARFCIDPYRIVFVELHNEKQMLWVMEEALRSKGLTAAFVEAPEASLTATRRLQLAAEDSGVTGFLLRPNPKRTSSSACVTSWQVKALPSQTRGKPGVGLPRWQIELLKVRNGRLGSWLVEWQAGQLGLIEPVQRQPIPALASRAI